MREESGWRWGSHAQFARLYDTFLDAVYRPDPSRPAINGRRQLAMSIATTIKDRGPGSILDCAAGSGFPALDLVVDLAKDGGGFTVHCTDGDPTMAAMLAKRAARRGLRVNDLAPPRRPGIKVPKGVCPLVLKWTQLERISILYDHVLCRGNALPYADTWADQTSVANEHLLATYLERMMRKVRPGGYLHVDAPWQLDLPKRSYRSIVGTIEEEVIADERRRQWTVLFNDPRDQRPLAFRRYSSLLTIDRVETILKSLGMEDVTPFQLDAERPAFGTIIARRPTRSSALPDGTGGSGQRPPHTPDARHADVPIPLPRLRQPTRPRIGTHSEFVDRYERYLDAIYERGIDGRFEYGRSGLMRSITKQMRRRRVVNVLDCAAGTGFPILDVAAESRGEFRVHCSDGDGLMIEVLTRRAKELGLPLFNLAPPRGQTPGGRARDLVLNWAELDDVTRQYDYVLCRGNSLTYAGTWAGEEKVASGALITKYLTIIAARVRLGGYLHIDAPWVLDLEAKNRSLGTNSVWEQVSADRDKREWRLTFTGSDDRAIEFKRYSAPVTIDDLRVTLDRLGFEETEPFALDGERDSFGVIIARKVHRI